MSQTRYYRSSFVALNFSHAHHRGDVQLEAWPDVWKISAVIAQNLVNLVEPKIQKQLILDSVFKGGSF